MYDTYSKEQGRWSEVVDRKKNLFAYLARVPKRQIILSPYGERNGGHHWITSYCLDFVITFSLSFSTYEIISSQFPFSLSFLTYEIISSQFPFSLSFLTYEIISSQFPFSKSFLLNFLSSLFLKLLIPPFSLVLF